MFKYKYVCSSTLVQYSAQAWAQQAAANIYTMMTITSQQETDIYLH